MKFFSTIKKVALTLGLLTVGYIGGTIASEQPQPQAETQNNIHNGVNQIESGKRNVFSQYFTITKLDEKGADVVNRYNEDDTYYINKEEFNLDFSTLKVNEPIVVTFDHDTTLDAVRDKSMISQYKLFENKDLDAKYIYGVNIDNKENTVVLEREDHKEGDIVNVTFEDDIHDNITKVVKIGTFDVYEDSFNYNAEHDENRNNPNYVQTEDGSFVPKSFHEGGNE
jgi:hypothetical protein